MSPQLLPREVSRRCERRAVFISFTTFENAISFNALEICLCARRAPAPDPASTPLVARSQTLAPRERSQARAHVKLADGHGHRFVGMRHARAHTNTQQTHPSAYCNTLCEREIFINQQEITTLTVIWARQLVSPQPKLGPVP